MIVIDWQGIHPYIVIQRPDKAYTYLHRQFKGEIKTDKYHFTKAVVLLEGYRGLFAIGPNSLVVWSSEDEDGLC